MKRIIKFLFPAYSKWHDIEMFERAGHYKLIQMRYRLDNNKKFFRVASMGFVNDPSQRPSIYWAVLSINKDGQQERSILPANI